MLTPALLFALLSLGGTGGPFVSFRNETETKKKTNRKLNKQPSHVFFFSFFQRATEKPGEALVQGEPSLTTSLETCPRLPLIPQRVETGLKEGTPKEAVT